jgi:hypothetical protein
MELVTDAMTGSASTLTGRPDLVVRIAGDDTLMEDRAANTGSLVLEIENRASPTTLPATEVDVGGALESTLCVATTCAPAGWANAPSEFRGPLGIGERMQVVLSFSPLLTDPGHVRTNVGVRVVAKYDPGSGPVLDASTHVLPVRLLPGEADLALMDLRLDGRGGISGGILNLGPDLAVIPSVTFILERDARTVTSTGHEFLCRSTRRQEVRCVPRAPRVMNVPGPVAFAFEVDVFPAWIEVFIDEVTTDPVTSNNRVLLDCPITGKCIPR